MDSTGELEKRLGVFERALDTQIKFTSVEQPVLELDLTLPKAEIGGLRFNETKVHGVFEKREDGWWHSRDILFLSARNTKEDNSRDILMEYLNLPSGNENDVNLKVQICKALKAKYIDRVEISLPKENEGVKQYNGVDWWYWLLPGYSAAYFGTVNGVGASGITEASAACGCAPIFRIV